MRLLVFLFLTVISLSCSLNQQSDSLTVEEKALMALMIQDYSLQEKLSGSESIEREDLMTPVVTSGLSTSSRMISVVSEETYTLDDGTEVYIYRELDDQDTADDTSDDLLTVSRQYFYESQLWKTEEIIRPLKPEADWAIWSDDRLLQEGSVKSLLDQTTISTGTIQALWIMDSGEIILSEFHKSTFNIATNIKRNSDIWYDDDRTVQTISKYFWNGSELVEITLYTVEIIEIDDVPYKKLVSEDGSYILIKQQSAPQVREYYHDDDTLYLVETIGKNGGVRTEVTREFYEEGVLVDTKVINISYSFSEDSVRITKKVDSGLRKMTIEISELGEGYLIERNGSIYQVVFSSEGSVLLYSETGEFLAEITTAPDDSAIVTDSDGTVTSVNF